MTPKKSRKVEEKVEENNIRGFVRPQQLKEFKEEVNG